MDESGFMAVARFDLPEHASGSQRPERRRRQAALSLHAALEKAHRLADALLSRADGRVPWADGGLVVESDDASDPVAAPIIDAVMSDGTMGDVTLRVAKATRH